MVANDRSKCCRCGHRTENAALRLDHGKTGIVKFRKIGGAAVGQHDAAKAAVVGFAHRGIDADFRGHAGDEQRIDPPVAQHEFKIGLVKCPFARFVDDRLALERIKLRDDVVTGFAANQDASHRTAGADAGGGIAALDLMRRRVRQIGPMPLAGVNDEEVQAPGRGKHRAARRHRRAQERNIVAERFAEAARLQKIALHVDNDIRRGVEIDDQRRGFSFELLRAACGSPASQQVQTCKIGARTAQIGAGCLATIA